MRRGEVLGIVQAGGQGSRMDVLTRERAKPALPFGGVNRLVDFALSALVHAEVEDVWVSVQYQVASIDDYLAGGRPWSMDRNRGGFRRMVPQTGTGPATEEGFASGNADLLLKLHADIAEHGADHVVITSADHVFNMDLLPVVEEHVARGSTATLVTAEVTKKEASDNVAVLLDGHGVVRDLEVKVSRPSTGTVATEIFVYRTEPFLEALEALRAELDDESASALSTAIIKAWQSAGSEAKHKWCVYQRGVFETRERLLEVGHKLDAFTSGGSHHLAGWHLDTLARHGRVPGQEQSIDEALSWVAHWAVEAETRSLKSKARDLLQREKEARKLKDEELREMIDPARVLAVGDGMPTDVRGALSEGLDLLYISAGIHARDYMTGDVTDVKRLDDFLADHQAEPRWWMPRLA